MTALLGFVSLLLMETCLTSWLLMFKLENDQEGELLVIICHPEAVKRDRDQLVSSPQAGALQVSDLERHPQWPVPAGAAAEPGRPEGR